MIVAWKVDKVAQARGIQNASQLAVIVGINKNTANTLWNGSSLRVDRETLAKLCKALNCTIGDLLEYQNGAHSAAMLAA